MLEKADDVIEKLGLLVELSVPPFDPKGLTLGPVEERVLELCDLKHTRQEMASELKKSLNVIDQRLNKLRERRLIKSVQIGGDTLYLRLSR